MKQTKRKGQPAGSAACRRGQGALEYLMTYGWAILIIVIIGGALYALGVFNPASWTSSKRATGFASLQVKDWKITPSATTGATLVIGNKYGAGVTVKGFNFNVTSPTVWCWIDPLTTTSMAENQELTLISTNCNATSLVKGKSYSADVAIFFTSGTVDHIDSGTITGKVE